MLSYQVYKIVHLVSLFGAFMCLGALIASRGAEGGKNLKMALGIFLALALVGGFGLLARLQVGVQPWVYVKIGVWLAVGGYLSVIARKPERALVHWVVLLALGAVGAYTALYKPF